MEKYFYYIESVTTSEKVAYTFIEPFENVSKITYQIKKAIEKKLIAKDQYIATRFFKLDNEVKEKMICIREFLKN